MSDEPFNQREHLISTGSEPDRAPEPTPEPEQPTVKPLWDGWRQPQNAVEALDIALNYAEMEGLWCKSMLFKAKHTEPAHSRRNKAYVQNPEDPNDRTCFCEACVSKRTWDERLENQGLTCGDIQACSVGIVIMAVLDGPAVNAYFRERQDGDGDEDDIQELLYADPVGAPTLICLEAGMRKVAAEITAEMQDEPDLVADEEQDNANRIKRFLKPPTRGAKVGGPTHRRFQADAAAEAASQVIDFNDGDLGDGLLKQKTTKKGYAVGKSIDLDPDGNKYHERIVKSFRYAREYAAQFMPTEPEQSPAAES